MALGALVKRGAAQGHALIDGATIANLSRLAHHHAHGVVKEHLVADLGARVNLDAGEKTSHMGNKATQPFQAMVPAPVGTPVQDHGMQARVASQNFPGAAGGGVAVKNALNVGTKA